jgi:hypothetical protein
MRTVAMIADETEQEPAERRHQERQAQCKGRLEPAQMQVVRHRHHQEGVEDEIVEIENPGKEAERDNTVVQPAHRLLAQQPCGTSGRSGARGWAGFAHRGP